MKTHDITDKVLKLIEKKNIFSKIEDDFFSQKLSNRRHIKAKQTDLQTCQTHRQTDGTT